MSKATRRDSRGRVFGRRFEACKQDRRPLRSHEMEPDKGFASTLHGLRGAQLTLLGVLVPLMLTACPTRRPFRRHSYSSGGSGTTAGSGMTAGYAGGAGTHGGVNAGGTAGVPSSGGTPSFGGDGADEGGMPNAGASEGGSANESNDCPQPYRCEGSVLERCTSGGGWVTEDQCIPPNGVCNAQAHACLTFNFSGNFVSLGAPASTGGPRVSDGQFFLAPSVCNSAKTVCVRGGFLP
jgi:hypothetical protein